MLLLITRQDDAVEAHQALYADLMQQSWQPDWRFRGVFTDGGVDRSEETQQYWVPPALELLATLQN